MTVGCGPVICATRGVDGVVGPGTLGGGGKEHCLRTRDHDLDQAIINQLPDCIAQRGMGELLPVLPPLTCQEELMSIMVDSPHEMQDQHPCETRFQLRFVCFQSISEGDDVPQVRLVWAKEHVQ